jgi:NAD(P)-dependent dehydrogenase (short-subunit alcohol dehydrogenase family)
MTSPADTRSRLAGKVVIVTGGSSGIGAAVARRVAADGAAVVIAARGTAAGESVTADIVSHGGRAIFQPTDVTVEEDVARLVDRALRDYGGVSGAFNNAGDVTSLLSVPEIDAQSWHFEIDENLTSVFLCLKYQIPAILVAGGGAIVNNASLGGVRGIPGLAPYVAAKHGVVGLTRSAALEFADRGVRVNALVTGNVDTPLYRRLLGISPDEPLPDAPNPTGRVASADEIAAYVAYLLSDEAAFVTGAALAIDGGATA